MAILVILRPLILLVLSVALVSGLVVASGLEDIWLGHALGSIIVVALASALLLEVVSLLSMHFS